MKLLRNKYRWLAILVALWTRGVGFVIGAPPETVDFKTTSFTPLPVVLTEEKDTLIFSDSPEYVNKSGVLAAGTVNGTDRVYFYHVNEMKEPQKIAIVLENTSKKNVEVTVHREIFAEPNREYFVVGSELSREDLDAPYVGTNRQWQPAAQRERSAKAAGVPVPTVTAKKDTIEQIADTATTDKSTVGTAVANTATANVVTANTSGAIEKMAVAGQRGDDEAVKVGDDVVGKQREQAVKAWRTEVRQQAQAEAKLKPTVLDTVTLAPGGKQAFFSKLDKIPIPQDDLFSGIFDFTSTGPVYVKVMMLPFETPALGGSLMAETLPMDEVALRGTYVGAQRRLTLMQPFDSSLGPVSVMVANDREDPFVEGVDELTPNAPSNASGTGSAAGVAGATGDISTATAVSGTAVTNRGNYGVSYEVTIPTMGNRDFALYINPLGGAYAGSFKVTYDGQSEIYNVPTGARLFLGNNTTEDSQYFNTYKAGKLLTIQFIPAGASNLPIQFLLVPQA